MKIIQSIVLVTLFCCTCSCSYPESVIQTAKKAQAGAQPTTDAPKPEEWDNESLWEKIMVRPDSATLSLTINETTKALLVISGKLDSTGGYFYPRTITVFYPSGMKQELQVKESVGVWEKSQHKPYLDFQDMNFDGHSDVHVFDNAGATGNFWYRVWLYDAKKGFTFSESFSAVSSPKIVSRLKQILSYYRTGHCEEQTLHYTVKGDQLWPIKRIFNRLEDCDSATGCICVTYKSELKGKDWTDSKIDGEVRPIYDSVYAN